MNQEETAIDELELNLETYDSISGNREFWNVQIDQNFDLLIYKKINNSWSNQTTVRFREGNHDSTELRKIPEYFLSNLKSSFPSLLYLKSSTNNVYSGSENILKVLTKYLSAGEMKNAELKIGKRKYKLLSNLSGGVFFAKPSILKSIEGNERVKRAEDRDQRIELIWHKKDKYIIKRTEKGNTYYEIAQNDAGFLVNELIQTILGMPEESNLKKYIKKYVLDNLTGEDYLSSVPDKLKITDKYDGSTVFSFKCGLTALETQLWRMVSSTDNSSVLSAERHIHSVIGVKDGATFEIKKDSDHAHWVVDWKGKAAVLSFRGQLQNQTLYEMFLARNNELNSFEITINPSENSDIEQVELWLKAINLVLDNKN